MAGKQFFRARIKNGKPDEAMAHQPDADRHRHSWLKSPEARERNVARAIHVLSGNKGRFMARSW